MSYITGAIYPSSDRPQLGATEEETLRAYADENTAVALGYANPDIHELHARCIPRPTAAPHPRQHRRQVRPRARGTRERQRRD